MSSDEMKADDLSRHVESWKAQIPDRLKHIALLTDPSAFDHADVLGREIIGLIDSLDAARRRSEELRDKLHAGLSGTTETLKEAIASRGDFKQVAERLVERIQNLTAGNASTN